MNETLLIDLQKKMRNLLHDFELEHGLPSGMIDLSKDANRITVEVKESGGYRGARGILSESIYLTDPLTGEVPTGLVIDLDDVGETEKAASSIRATYDPIHYADVEANARKQSDALPVLDESDYTSDTDLMTAQSDPLTTAPDLQSPTPGGVMYDDAPGLVFNSPAEYDNWRAQRDQKRNRR